MASLIQRILLLLHSGSAEALRCCKCYSFFSNIVAFLSFSFYFDTIQVCLLFTGFEAMLENRLVDVGLKKK